MKALGLRFPPEEPKKAEEEFVKEPEPEYAIDADHDFNKHPVRIED